MDKSQKKVARMILEQGLSLKEAHRINTSGGFLFTKEKFVKLNKDKLEEAFEWAVHIAKKSDKNDRMRYLVTAILSFIMVPFAFSGFLETRPILAWAGQFELGIILILIGIYFLREYRKKLKN